MGTDSLGYDEGSVCNRDGCKGLIEIGPSENCSCHISPPCYSCTSPRGFCPECGWRECDDPKPNPSKFDVINDCVVKKGTWDPVRPRTLDKSRVDWYSKSHTNSSMIKEGVYPESGDTAKDRESVRKLVNGTFGGRFEYFGNGQFKFIAYTD